MVDKGSIYFIGVNSVSFSKQHFKTTAHTVAHKLISCLSLLVTGIPTTIFRNRNILWEKTKAIEYTTKSLASLYVTEFLLMSFEFHWKCFICLTTGCFFSEINIEEDWVGMHVWYVVYMVHFAAVPSLLKI